MAFSPRTDWKNLPDESTPVAAADLIRIETGVAEAHDGLAELPSEFFTGDYNALDNKPTIPPAPAAGTAAQLTAGTDTVQRTWSAKMIADEIDARVAAAIAAIPPAE